MMVERNQIDLDDATKGFEGYRLELLRKREKEELMEKDEVSL